MWLYLFRPFEGNGRRSSWSSGRGRLRGGGRGELGERWDSWIGRSQRGVCCPCPFGVTVVCFIHHSHVCFSWTAQLLDCDCFCCILVSSPGEVLFERPSGRAVLAETLSGKWNGSRRVQLSTKAWRPYLLCMVCFFALFSCISIFFLFCCCIYLLSSVFSYWLSQSTLCYMWGMVFWSATNTSIFSFGKGKLRSRGLQRRVLPIYRFIYSHCNPGIKWIAKKSEHAWDKVTIN